jgi:hypothetical protein
MVAGLIFAVVALRTGCGIFGSIGAADEVPRTLLMTAGWAINLAAAEYIIRQRLQRPNHGPAGLGRPATTDALVA